MNSTIGPGEESAILCSSGALLVTISRRIRLTSGESCDVEFRQEKGYWHLGGGRPLTATSWQSRQGRREVQASHRGRPDARRGLVLPGYDPQRVRRVGTGDRVLPAIGPVRAGREAGDPALQYGERPSSARARGPGSRNLHAGNQRRSR